jgi:hypothetical protein
MEPVGRSGCMNFLIILVVVAALLVIGGAMVH